MYIYIYEIFWEPGIVYPVKGFFIIFFIISLSFWDLPKYHLFIIYLSFIYHLFIIYLSFIYWLLLGESLFAGLPGEC